jgi:hypothetical protein
MFILIKGYYAVATNVLQTTPMSAFGPKKALTERAKNESDLDEEMNNVIDPIWMHRTYDQIKIQLNLYALLHPNYRPGRSHKP